MKQAHLGLLLFLILLLKGEAKKLSFEHAAFETSNITYIVLVKEEAEWYQGQDSVSFTEST